MKASADDPAKHRSLFLALGLALLAWAGMGKFPGPSGLIGAAGWLLLAATVLAAPSLAAVKPRLPERHRGLMLLSFGAALALVVGSVIVWSFAR